jgi:hypothetical protein
MHFQRLSIYFICCVTACLIFSGDVIRASDFFDIVSGVIESPQFKGNDPITKLRLAADMLRDRHAKRSDLSLLLLDWGDQYVRGPSDPLERLNRWAELTRDEQLSSLRLPRDYLNRMLLAEYLVAQPGYFQSAPQKRLEIIGALSAKNLVDWSVALNYARLYAGGIITGATDYKIVTPLESLRNLKKLKDAGLVTWQYWVSAESVIVAELLASDEAFRTAEPYGQLAKLRDLERQGLISSLTKRELEKLPTWRLLGSDPSFLKSDPAAMTDRLTRLKEDGMISPSTFSDLTNMFRPIPVVSPVESRPTLLPQQIVPTGK